MVRRVNAGVVNKITNMICLSALLCLLSQSALSDPIKVTRYEVKAQDTVLGIAQKLLPDPGEWPKVFLANNEAEAVLHPGDVLEKVEGADKTTITKLSMETTRLLPTVRSTGMDKAIPVIPMPVLSPFLNKSRILPESALQHAAKIIGFEGEHFSVGQGSYLFVQGVMTDQPIEYDVFIPGKTLKDPHHSKAILGVEAQIIGHARLEKRGEPSIFYLSKSLKEVSLGDYLLPSEKRAVEANFLLHYPENPAEGRILSILDGIEQVGQYSIVAISGGNDFGRQPGDLLAICKPSTQVPSRLRHELPASTQYPKTQVGAVLVFQVFDKASYALVTEAKDFIAVQDEITSWTH